MKKKDLTAEGAEGAEDKEEGKDALVDGQWKVGEWQGCEQHTCVICKWDTLEGLWAAREHKALCEKCAPPPPWTVARPDPEI